MMEAMAMLQRSLLASRPAGRPSTAVASTSGRCTADSTAAAAISHGSRRCQRCLHAVMCFPNQLTPRSYALYPSPNSARRSPTCCCPDLFRVACCRRRSHDVLSSERRLSHTSVAAESQTSGATISPVERETAEAEGNPEAPQADDGDEPAYTPEALEAAAQTLAELLPGSVPTPRLQPPEVNPRRLKLSPHNSAPCLCRGD